MISNTFSQFALATLTLMWTCNPFPAQTIESNFDSNIDHFQSIYSNAIIDSKNPYLPTTKYDADWKSLDSRPLPVWYDQAKIGIFIHWGVFSVPSFGSEWFWWNWKNLSKPEVVHFMQQCYKPDFEYTDFGPEFTAEFFNGSEWAELFQQSGAKYVVLTSKHHEGFALWPSKYSWNWNSLTNGPKKDLIQELSQQVRKHNLRFGLYHSMFEWFNPLWINDRSNNFTTNYFVKNKVLPEMIELVNNYFPEIFWSDGDWEATDDYWQSKQFLAWLYNDSPVKDTVVVNDRWGYDTYCKHGGFYNCADRFKPDKLMAHKWENAMTLDKTSWGFARNSKLNDYMTINELIEELISTVSYGGNLLLNVGPTHDGRIPIIFQERLFQLGKWLKVNGEAIYNTVPFQNPIDKLTKNVWYTQSSDTNTFYCLFNQWPRSNNLVLSIAQLMPKLSSIELLLPGSTMTLNHTINSDHVLIHLDPIILLDTQWAWVIRFVKHNVHSNQI